MEKYLILGKKENVEIEGEEYSKDNRFFIVETKDTGAFFLFIKESGTYISYSKSKEALESAYDQIIKVFDTLVLTKKYHKDVNKFNARNEKGKVRKL